jgi:WD40 repeat protein
VLILRGPEYPVESLAFSADAATLHAVQRSAGVWAWNLAARTAARFRTADGAWVWGAFLVHPAGRWAFGMCWSSESRWTRAIDLTTGATAPINVLTRGGQDVALSPDGSRVVTYGHSDIDKDRPATGRTYRLYGWNLTDAGPTYAWHRDTPGEAHPWRIVYAGDATLVTEDWAVSGPPRAGTPSKGPLLWVRSAADGQPIRAVEPPNDQIEQLLASPDGRQLVVRRGVALWVYDPTDWDKPPVAVDGQRRNAVEPSAAAFHPSGRHLLLANNGPSVLVFDTRTWKVVRKWKWDVGTLRATAVSLDGTLAAAAGPRGRVVVWDLDL